MQSIGRFQLWLVHIVFALLLRELIFTHGGMWMLNISCLVMRKEHVSRLHMDRNHSEVDFVELLEDAVCLDGEQVYIDFDMT